MDFGRPDNPALVDWTLPPDTDLTEEVLRGLTTPAGQPRSAFIGSTAWGQRDLVGAYYPRGTKPAGYLSAYAKQFNSIELNATFYRVPNFAQVRTWRASVPEDFRFCPKVHQAISQSGNLGVSTSRTLDFAKSVQHFESRLGPCFIQLPSTFDTSKVDALRFWLDTWPQHLELAVELRHDSWFSGSEVAENLFAELYTRGVGSVITDVGGRRDVAHMNVSSAFTMVRWVGTLHASDEGRLDEWASRLSTWYGEGLERSYVFTHEPEEVPSARAASTFERVLRKHYTGDLSVRSPTPLEQASQEQPSLFS